MKLNDKAISIAKGMMIFIISFAFLSLLFTNHSSRELKEIASFFLEESEGMNENTWKSITTVQEKLKEEANIDGYYVLLNLYLQAVRENAQSKYFNNTLEILSILDTQTEIENHNNPLSELIRIQILLAKHQFSEARKLTERLFLSSPENTQYLGLFFDSLVELGEYKEAERTLDAMLAIKPDNNAYTRAAYLREIYGDLEGAIELMERSILNGSLHAENQAWNYSELGRLWKSIDPAKSIASFQKGIQIYPNHFFSSLGIAKNAYDPQDISKALSLYEKILSNQPLPEVATQIGDIYFINGSQEKSEIYYRLVEIGYENIQQAGTDVSLEKSRFLLERSRNLSIALELAREAYKKQPNIFAADNLAWAYALNGDNDKALEYREKSLVTGSKSPTILYHSDVILLNKSKDEAILTRLQELSQKKVLSPLEQNNLEEILSSYLSA